MNKQTNEKALFDAISGIDDALIDEAAAPRVRHFPRRRILQISAIAACFLLLFCIALFKSLFTTPDNHTVDGLFITALASENSSSIDEVLPIGTSLNCYWSPAHSTTPGLPLSFLYKSSHYASEDITFHLSLSGGSCMKWNNGRNWYIKNDSPQQLPDSFVIKNKSIVYWRDFRFINGERIEYEDNIFYVDVIIYANDRIIGYAVLELRRVLTEAGETTPYLQVLLLASETFEQSSDEITKEYVNTLIESARHS